MAKEKPVENETPMYTKQQFVQSERYQGVEKDVLTVILEDEMSYSIAEVEKMMEDFQNRKVK